MKTLAIIAAVLALAVPASTQTPSLFTQNATGTEGVTARGPNTLIIYLHRSTDATNNTIPVVAEGGDHRVSGWQTLDLTQYGVPATAVSVDIYVRLVHTKGSWGATTVWAHARPTGSVCCRGPDGYRGYPLDGAWSGQPSQEGLIAQMLTVPIEDSRRENAAVLTAVNAGQLDVSWGYRLAVGDSVAVVVYLNGYST